MDSRDSLFSLHIEDNDGVSPAEKHPTDGEVIHTSKDNNVRSLIHVIPRREPDGAVVYMRVSVKGEKPFTLNITRPSGSEVTGLSVVLSGDSIVEFADGAVWRYSGGRCTLTATHAHEPVVWKIHPGEKYEAIAFTYSRDERLAAFKDIHPPPELAGFTGEHIESRMVWYAPATPLFIRIAREAVANPYRGPAKQFFLESKALEMLSEMAALLDQSRPPPEDAVTEDDRQRLHEVRHTLMAGHDNPPSLVDLARGAGMSHKKLNQIFSREFGVSMHTFLRDYRLEQGQKMVAEGRGVKETAYALGYRHPSNFIAAYRKKFGASPGAQRKSTA